MKKGVFILAILWLSLHCAGAELESLSEVFHLGKGILDKDKDGQFSKTELQEVRGRLGQKGEIITGAARGERYEDTLKVGDVAPDFTLADPSERRQVTLSSFRGKKPVVLIFGSYT